MGIFLQYAPYTLRDANWDELREPYGDRVLELISEYAPNMRDIVREAPGPESARSRAPLRNLRRQHLSR